MFFGNPVSLLAIMKKLIRPALLVVPLFTGIFFPQAAILAQGPWNFIRWALVAMIFFNVLQINFADLKPRKEHFLVLAANVFMGIVPFYLFKLLIPSADIYAHGAFFTGIAPTAAATAVIVGLLDGHVGFAVTGFLITNIGISILLLGLLPLVTGNFTAVFMLNVFYSIMTTIIIPMACARAVRHFLPGILDHTAKFKSLTLVLWSASLFILAAVARLNFDQNSDASLGVLGILALTAGVICAVNFTVGYFLTKSEYRRDTSQILGQKNTTFAIYLALEFSSGIAALATIFYVLFHNLWNSVQLFLHDRKSEGHPDSASGE